MRPTDLKTAAKRVAVALATAILLVNGLPTTAIAQVVSDYMEQQQMLDTVREANEPAAQSAADDSASTASATATADGQAAAGDTAPGDAENTASDGTATAGDTAGQTGSGEQSSAENEDAGDGSATSNNATGDNAATGEDAPAGDKAAATATADDVVDGSHMGDKDAARTQAPELSQQEYRALSTMSAKAPKATKSLKAKAAKSDNQKLEAADGTKIEQPKLEWITEDNVEPADDEPALLSYAPNGSGKFNVAFRVSLQLKSEKDYAAGSIQLTIPTELMKDRNGNPIGDILFAVPEAPNNRAAFAYTNMGNYYVLTNTRKLSASTSNVMFEFHLRNIDPTAVYGNINSQDGGKALASMFTAALSVKAPNGEQLSATSDPIGAHFDTKSTIKNAYVQKDETSSEWKKDWPETLKPAGEDEPDYVYMRFTSYVDVSGNQPYTMSAEHKFSCTYTVGSNESKDDVKVLGYTFAGKTTKADGNATGVTVDTQQDPKYTGGRGHYVTVYVAIKPDYDAKSRQYKVTDNVKYTLKNQDNEDEETKSAPEHGFYNVHSGEVEFGGGNTKLYKTGDNRYENALDDLASGQDTTATYTVRSAMFGDTKVQTDDGGAEETNRTVRTDITDGALGITGISGKLVPGTDYEFEKLLIARPNTYKLKVFTQDGVGARVGDKGVTSYSVKAGETAYQADNTLAAPDVQVWGKLNKADVEDTLLATVKWGAGNTSATVTWAEGVAGADAVSTSSASLTLPAGVTNITLRSQTDIDAYYYSARVDVKLKGTSKELKALAEERLKNDSTNDVTLTNTATIANYVVAEDGVTTPLGNAKNVSASDYLGRTNKSIKQKRDVTKTVDLIKDEDSDKDADQQAIALQTYRHRHTSTMTLSATNVADRAAYNQAIADGKIKIETEATWTETLPKGVTIDLSTIKLSEGDTLEGVETKTDKDGNTIVTVTAKVTAGTKEKYEKHTITYDTAYSFIAVKTYGNEPVFKSEYKALDGKKDAADTSVKKECTEPKFEYDANEVSASVDGSGIYSDGKSGDQTAFAQGLYTYRLYTVAASDGATTSATSNVVMFDKLDAYQPSGKDDDAGKSGWQGTFAGVDMSAAKAAYPDIAPKVYYSTKANLELDNDQNRVLTNTDNWTLLTGNETEETLASVKIVAIDASSDESGNSVSLTSGVPLAFYVNMRAPQLSETVTGDMSAYNNMSVSYKLGEENPTEKFSASGYTKVGIKPFTVTVKSTWDDDNDRDGKRPAEETVKLLNDGREVTGYTGIKLSAADDWTTILDNLPKVNANGKTISYSIESVDKPDGYTLSNAGLSYTSSGLTVALKNTHTPERVSVTGTKVWDDNSNAAGKRPSSVRLVLSANGKQLDTKTVRDTNSVGDAWDFSFDNLYKFEGGQPITYSVTEDDTYYKGYIPATVTEPSDTNSAWTVTNTYDPAGTLVITNTANDATMAAQSQDFTFTLDLSDEDGKPVVGTYEYKLYDAANNEISTEDGQPRSISTGSSLTLKPGQVAKVLRVPSESTYRVTEDAPAGFTAASAEQTGSIRAGRDSQANFTNTYRATGSVQLHAVKTVNKDTNPLAPKAEQFSFGVYQQVGGEDKLIATATNAAGSEGRDDKGGAITFPLISYTQADVLNAETNSREFTYTVKELGDSKTGFTNADAQKVTVQVSDTEGNGKLTATVTSVEQIQSAENPGSEDTAASDDADLVTTDVDQARHPERSAEGAESKDLATSKNPIQFDNKYKADGSLTLNAWTELKGRELTENKFTFKLQPADDNPEAPMPEGATEDNPGVTAQNTAGGTITFDAIPFNQTHIGKTYKYVVSQVAPEGDAADPDIQYSTKEFIATVEVKDGGDGKLAFSYTWDDTPMFTNTLKPGSLRIVKKLANGEPADPNQLFKFHIQLTPTDGQTLPANPEISYEFQNENDSADTADSAATPDTVTDTATTEPADTATAEATTAADTAQDPTTAATDADQDRHPERSAEGTESKDLPATDTKATKKTKSTKTKAAAADDDTANWTGIWAGDPGAMPSYPQTGAKSESGFENQLCGKDDSVKYTLYDDGTVVFEPADGQSGRINLDTLPWHGDTSSLYSEAENIKAVIFRDGISWEGTMWSAIGNSNSASVALPNLEFADLSKLNTTGVPSAEYLFANCKKLEAVNLNGMFFKACTAMFAYCEQLKTVDMRNVTIAGDSMSYMFYDCKNLESIVFKDLSAPNLTNVSFMFSASSYDNYMHLKSARLVGLVMPKLGNLLKCFYSCRLLETVEFSFKGDAPKPAELRAAFAHCESLKSMDLSSMNLSAVTNMQEVFYNCKSLSYIKTQENEEPSEGTFDLRGISFAGTSPRLYNSFHNCTNLKVLEASGVAWSSLASMNSMLFGCSSLTTVNMPGADLSKVTDIGSLFADCTNLQTVDMSSAKVTVLAGMFSGLTSLTSVDMSGVDFGNVTSFANMFNGCTSLSKIAMGSKKVSELAEGTADLSGLKADKVTNIQQMFASCKTLQVLDLSDADFSAVTGGNNESVLKFISGCTSLDTLNMKGAKLSKLMSFYGLFSTSYDHQNLRVVDFSGADLSSLTSMSTTFQNYSSLGTVSFNGAKLDSLESAYQMLAMTNNTSMANTQLKIVDFSDANAPKLANMSSMFQGCTKLETLKLPNVTTSGQSVSMAAAFSNCLSLESLDLTPLLGITVTGADSAFTGVSKLMKVYINANTPSDLIKNLPATSPDGYSNNWEHFEKPGTGYTAEGLADAIANGKAEAGWWQRQKDATKFYTVTYSVGSYPTVEGDPNSGKEIAEGQYSGSMSPVEVYKDTQHELPTCSYVVPGYSFAGWKVDGYTGVKKPGDKVKGTAGGEPKVTATWAKLAVPDASDGSFGIELGANQAATIKNLPANTGYVVYEQTTQGWELVTNGATNAEGQIAIGDMDKYGGQATATFTNRRYTSADPQPATVNLAARVTLDGNPVADAGKFSFKLTRPDDASGNAVSQEVKNSTGGGITFDQLTFKDAGEYKYTISQENTTSDAITYDTTSVTATVNVTKEKGVISATVTYEKGDKKVDIPTFANTSKDVPAKNGTFTLSATVNNAEPAKDSKAKFSYRVQAGAKTFNVDLPTKDGSWSIDLGKFVIDTDVTVTETSSTTGYSPAANTAWSATIVAGSNNLAIDHTYHATGSAYLMAQKALTDRVLSADAFSFEVLASDADGKVEPDAKPVLVAGNEAGVTKDDDADAAVADAANASTAGFTSTGDVKFGALEFDTATQGYDGTAYYVVREVMPGAGVTAADGVEYDDANWLAKVELADNGDGTLKPAVSYKKLDGQTTDFSATVPTFNNAVQSGKLTVGANVTGGTDASTTHAFSYTVTLTDANGDAYKGSCAYEVVAADGGADAESDGADSVDAADPLEVGSTGALKNGDTFEMVQSAKLQLAVPDGVKYAVTLTLPKGFSATELSKNGDVEANAVSDAVFSVTYATSGAFTPVVETTYASGVLEAGMFSVALAPVDAGGSQGFSASNGVGTTADGTAEPVERVTFDELSFDAPGTYEYKLAQVIPSGTDGSIAYDRTEVRLQLVAADNGDGTMAVTGKYLVDAGSGAIEAGEWASASVATSGESFYTFVNKRVTELPGTGREGIALATGAGLMLTLGCAALLLRRREQRGE